MDKKINKRFIDNIIFENEIDLKEEKHQCPHCLFKREEKITEEEFLCGLDYLKGDVDIKILDSSCLNANPVSSKNFANNLLMLNNRFFNKKFLITNCSFCNKEIASAIQNTDNLLIDAKVFSLESNNFFDRVNVKEFLREFANKIFRVNLIYFGDLDLLKRDIENLYKLSNIFESRVISISLLDFNKNSENGIKYNYVISSNTFNEAIKWLNDNVKYPEYFIRSLSDSPNLIKKFDSDIHPENRRLFFISKINDLIIQMRNMGRNFNEVGFLVSESEYYFAKEYFENLKFIKVKNVTIGGSYTTPDFLSFNDYINAVVNNKKFKSYVISKNTFRNKNFDINDFHMFYDYLKVLKSVYIV
jgi:hypothetical protein